MFPCRQGDCQYAAENKEQLVRHYLAVHHRYLCSHGDCSSDYGDKPALSNHVKEEHQRMRVYCVTCGKFFRRRNFFIHKKTARQGEVLIDGKNPICGNTPLEWRTVGQGICCLFSYLI